MDNHMDAYKRLSLGSMSFNLERFLIDLMSLSEGKRSRMCLSPPGCLQPNGLTLLRTERVKSGSHGWMGASLD